MAPSLKKKQKNSGYCLKTGWDQGSSLQGTEPTVVFFVFVFLVWLFICAAFLLFFFFWADMSVVEPQMEEQLRVLAERVQQLQADNDRLRATGEAGSSASSNEEVRSNNPPDARSTFERYMYIPRERKCPRFSGKSTDDLTVEDWVEEVRRSLESRHMSPAEQALFIYDHLDGEAKTEIKFRPVSERNNPETLLSALLEIYGCS